MRNHKPQNPRTRRTYLNHSNHVGNTLALDRPEQQFTLFFNLNLSRQNQHHEIRHPRHIQSIQQVIFGRQILHILPKTIDPHTRNLISRDIITRHIHALVQSTEGSSHIDIDGERHDGNLTGRTILAVENACCMGLFLVLKLLFLASLVPPVEFRFQLLVRGLASAPLDFACTVVRMDLALYWDLCCCAPFSWSLSVPLEACLLLKGLLVVLVVDRWWCIVWVAILLAPLDPLKRKGIEASLTEVISRIKCRWQEAEPNQAADVDGVDIKI